MLNSTAPSAGGPVPVFVKVAPDLSWDQLDEVVATVAEQDEVLPGKDGVRDLWDDGIVVAVNAGK